MFVNGVLYNSEVWQGLGATDITALEKIDHQLMRFICNSHAKTAVEFLYLESGSIPLKNIIASRRIMYLHHLLGREDRELIKRVYKAQKESPTPGDFVELVKEDLNVIGEAFDEETIFMRSKDQFKTIIKEKIRQSAFRDLKNLQMKHSKIMNIQYDGLQTQLYMTSPLFSNDMVKILVNMRSSMTKDIKNNFSSIYKGNMACRLKCSDPNAIDSQQHLLLCSALTDNITKEQNHIKYEDIFGSLEQQREAVLLLAKLLEARQEILEGESLPVGLITGPESAVADQ